MGSHATAPEEFYKSPLRTAHVQDGSQCGCHVSTCCQPENRVTSPCLPQNSSMNGGRKTYYRSVLTINAERRRPPQEEARKPVRTLVRRIGTPKRVLKDANKKYRAAVLLSTRLATFISECGEEECSDRLDNLKSLVELWEAGKKTKIVEVVQEQGTSKQQQPS